MDTLDLQRPSASFYYTLLNRHYCSDTRKISRSAAGWSVLREEYYTEGVVKKHQASFQVSRSNHTRAIFGIRSVFRSTILLSMNIRVAILFVLLGILPLSLAFSAEQLNSPGQNSEKPQLVLDTTNESLLLKVGKPNNEATPQPIKVNRKLPPAQAKKVAIPGDSPGLIFPGKLKADK